MPSTVRAQPGAKNIIQAAQVGGRKPALDHHLLPHSNSRKLDGRGKLGFGPRYFIIGYECPTTPWYLFYPHAPLFLKRDYSERQSNIVWVGWDFHPLVYLQMGTRARVGQGQVRNSFWVSHSVSGAHAAGLSSVLSQEHYQEAGLEAEL